ncbi:D-TA family PLP-dependent enzyme [Aureimonas jatrophae]|uniref:D-serine deaminase, pyridoxal phosphate-dependent n=1 Tax=Aureimonas jatrophae TaxID=1166073 RepID=A0A1H0C8Z7_9HYPH|nr:D-TA family PLP-dependent enzyme [Aureimonas jatrophae]MBB3949120.1 D-serine deaminase-like pyridoxal phosphate-dependent protein [Aureimonas jatrophae]SDN54329.1 D-serine deaminase, pyridoxal phosphate-dependent [Aureimonas jatrophae]
MSTIETDFLPAVGTPLDAVSTPRAVIDEARVERNVQRVQDYMDAHGLRFRPHIKTHKIPALAHQQLEAGAVGITCQKVSEAEAFASEGVEDILITFNILGPGKHEPLRRLNERVARLTVVADSRATVEALGAAFRDAVKPLTVLVECDTGGGRCGVQAPADALDLARRIAAEPGLRLGGIMTFPPGDAHGSVERFLSDARAMLETAGLPCPVVSNGGTPGVFQAHLVPSATEHRAGTYIYNDRSMVRAGACGWDDCAMHVLATVVSRPTRERAVIDAGSKALTSDLLGFRDYGHVEDWPEARIASLSEEHGVLDLSAVTGEGPAIGDVLRIVPNHTCVVSNLFDHVVFHRDGRVTQVVPVAARGLVW